MMKLMLSKDSQSQQGRNDIQVVTVQNELRRGSWASQAGFPEKVAVK